MRVRLQMSPFTDFLHHLQYPLGRKYIYTKETRILNVLNRITKLLRYHLPYPNKVTSTRLPLKRLINIVTIGTLQNHFYN